MEGRDIADSVTSDFETPQSPRSETSRSESPAARNKDRDWLC